MQENYPERPIVSSSRKSINVTLEVIMGVVPSDLYGYAFLNTPSGTVNSSLPYPKTLEDGSLNQEYGASTLGGDGYVMKFDFSVPGQINLQTRIVEAFPTYYADISTAQGSLLHTLLGFRNFGIARLSPLLGAREQAGTAFVPVRYASDKNWRLYATSDMGRPFEIDPKSLKCLAPVGAYKDYTAATPPMVPWIYPVLQTTAHPVFDPNSKYFYSINFTKALGEWENSADTFMSLHTKEAWKEAEQRLLSIARRHKKNPKTTEKIQAEILHFFKKFGLKPSTKQKNKKVSKASRTVEDAVYLMATNDGKVFNKWTLQLEDGSGIRIDQCVHQMGITEDYILFSDSAFKVTLDVLSPFAYVKEIDELIRSLTSVPQEAFTNIYVVRKADLQINLPTATVQRYKLSPEFVHFTTDYLNPNGVINMYSANNSAACLAEWIRFYDTLSDGSAADPSTTGILATGAMDVSRMGKAAINTTTQEINTQFLALTGKEAGGNGAHTWIAGFYSYAGMLSPYQVVPQIKNLYWQCSGLEQKRLSQFIYKLYENYPNRIVPVNEVLTYTEEGVPFQVSRLDTEKMEIPDYYSLEMGCEIMSLHFVPRKRPSSAPIVDPSMDGYILCAVIREASPTNFSRELWIFDAAQLSNGPVCKLSHPDMDFSTTLHWLWMETSPSNKGSLIPHIQEMDARIEANHSPYKKEIELWYKHMIKNLTY